MTLSLILLVAIVLVGAVLYGEHRLYMRRRADGNGDVQSSDDTQGAGDDGQECCGMHITCEKDSLLAFVSKEIEYYDDEELDRFAGKSSDGYTDAEIEEFRDVLITMKPSDIAGWARSLQLRNIALPAVVRDELLMIVAEARQNAAVS